MSLRVRRKRPSNRELGETLARELERVAKLCRAASSGDEKAQFELYSKHWDVKGDEPTYGLLVAADRGLAGAVIFPDAHEDPDRVAAEYN